MAAPADSTAPVMLDIMKMTKIQKLAVLLMMLDTDSAVQIVKSLDEHELQSISAEMAKMGLVTGELQTEILKEFSDVALQASTAVLGGVDRTRVVLEKAVGIFKASDLLGRAMPNQGPVNAMNRVSEMDTRQIFNLIKNEQAQTIALIASHLTSEKAAEVLCLLRPELREQAIERIATLAPTPADVVEKVVAVLTQKVGGKQLSPMHQTGGLKSAASVLNAMDKSLSKTILTSLDEHNPELSASIRQKMFTFEDLSVLDPSALQKVLREVDMRDLAVALKTASERLKGSLLACISKRAAETVNEEMSFLGPLRLKEIEAAQLKIIDVVRRLENEGEIDLSEARENNLNEALA
jgi:flagellar motor switch protein FliG